jgi:hypothetical protein
MHSKNSAYLYGCNGCGLYPDTLSNQWQILNNTPYRYCPKCMPSIIYQQQQLLGVIQNVQLFYRQSLAIDVRRLASNNDIQLVAPPLKESFAGLATSTRSDLGYLAGNIKIIKDLTWTNTAKILAHEYFHLYSAYRNLNLKHSHEEGAAQLVAYLWLRSRPTIQSRYCQHVMAADPNHIYGVHFRKALYIYEQSKGFRDFLKRWSSQ